MKALFAHNIRIKKDDKGNLYTHSSYNENVWKRYETISKHLSVIVRKEQQRYSQEQASRKFEVFDNLSKDVIYVNDIYRSIFSFINPINHIKNNKIIKNSVNNHDCIIARLPSFTGFKAIKYAKKRKIPYICEVVACSWDGLWNHSIKGKVMAPFSFLQLKKAVRNAPYVVYVTNEFLQKRYPTNGKNTNCSNVALTEFDDNVLMKRLSKIENMQKNCKVVIGTTAAVDVRYKGQQYIIQALGELKKQGITNYEYQLVGGGDQAHLKSIAEKYNVTEQVKFLGAMPHNKVFKWLETIDIYTQPSRQEGLPRALIEAMSTGCPSMGSTTAGIPELLNSKYIFNNGGVEEICKLLKKVNENEMVREARRNFEKAKEYDKKVLDNRRKEFLIQVQKDIEFDNM